MVPPPGAKFCRGAAVHDDVLRGVAIIGRPVTRMFDHGMTLEVVRTATGNKPHVNFLLYGAGRAVSGILWFELPCRFDFLV
ncbi:XF1762 family protein [Spirillospora sp. CA-253888]